MGRLVEDPHRLVAFLNACKEVDDALARGDAAAELRARERVVEIVPHLAPFRDSLAGLLRRRGHCVLAVQQYRRSFAIEPKALSAVGIARALGDLGRYGAALAWLRRARQFPQGDEFGGDLVVKALERLGRPEEALRDGLQQAERRPNDPYTLWTAARLLSRRGDGASARDFASRALALRPEDPVFVELHASLARPPKQ